MWGHAKRVACSGPVIVRGGVKHGLYKTAEVTFSLSLLNIRRKKGGGGRERRRKQRKSGVLDYPRSRRRLAPICDALEKCGFSTIWAYRNARIASDSALGTPTIRRVVAIRDSVRTHMHTRQRVKDQKMTFVSVPHDKERDGWNGKIHPLGST